MNLRTLLCAVLCSVAPLVAAGCSSDDGKAVVSTGWSGPLSGFTRIAGEGDTGIFTAGDAPIPLNAIFVAPAEVVLAPGSSLQSVTPDDLERLRAELMTAIKETVGRGFDISDTPRADAYILRSALTGLMAARSERSELPTGSRDLHFSFAGAAIESALREPTTNARRVVLIARPAISAGDQAAQSWTDIRGFMARYADALRAQLVELRAHLQRKAPAAAGNGKG